MIFYLYKKTHNTTGLKYLGITIRNPFTYKGSGLYWRRHIKEHGNDVTTEIIYETKCKNDLKGKGLFYSDLWNVVASKEWANLMVESADNSGSRTEDHKGKMSLAARNKYERGFIHPLLGKARTEEWKQNHSKTMKNIIPWNKGKKGVQDYSNLPPKSEETKRKISETKRKNPVVVSEETRKKLSDAAKLQWQRQHELRGV